MPCRKCERELPDSAAFCPYCGKRTTPVPRKSRQKPNGTGTVYPRNGKWVASHVVGWYRTEEGVLRKKTINRTFVKKSDAINALPTLKAAYKPVKPKTLYELYQEYMKTKDYENLSKSQRQKMGYAWVRWEPMGVISIADLTVSAIEDQIIEKTKSYYPAHDMKVLLSHLYKLAIKQEIVSHNKTEDIDLPYDAPKAKRECWTKAEIDALWDDYKSHPFTGYLLIMCYSGLRLGELSTIRLENIHLDENYMIGGIKTEAGIDREIPISAKIKPVIQTLMKGRKVKLLEMGENQFYEAYWATVERAGLRHLPPHTCRHYFFSRMTAAGVQGGIIAEVGGHANYLTTLKNYVRIPLKDKLAAVDKV